MQDFRDVCFKGNLLPTLKVGNKPCRVSHGRERQVNLCKFKASLVFIVNSSTARSM